MYAIIVDGGRQYKVHEGLEFELDYREASAGDELRFDQVLAFGDDSGTKIGQPTLAGAAVVAEVVGVSQGPKLVVQKMRRRKNSRRKTGHRQLHTKVRVSKILVG
ncbi:MAG TPA: 50S ribosomal protein L21 [Pirellulales bacterium]|jgi:large subunit ribosomal protein L21